MKTTTRNILAMLLLALGLTQIVGDISGIRLLKGIGAASAAAPFPKVFTDVNGLETFASQFTLYVYEESTHTWQSFPIDAERYSLLKGSYNRRNVYGAALSYAPRLPEELWTTVLRYGLGPDGPLREEMQLPDSGLIVVHIETQTRGRSDYWLLSTHHNLSPVLPPHLSRTHQETVP